METLLPPLQRGLLFVGVLLLGGILAWRAFIAPEAARTLGAGGDRALGTVEQGFLRLGGWVVLLLLLVWGLRLPVQLLGFRDPFAPLMEDVRFLVLETLWGSVWIAQGILLIALVPMFWAGASAHGTVAPRVQWGDPDPPPPLPWRWRLLGGGIIGVIATVALSSHAMSVPSNRPLAVVLDGAHTLAAGGWLGALTLIVVSGMGHKAASPEVQAAQFRAFSPVAMVSVGVLIFAGVLLSTQHVMAWENLWGSPYGRVLMLKIGVALGVMAIGALNWRSGLPRMDSEEGRRQLTHRARLEITLALVVLGITAILTGMPLPEITPL
jgi:putative copper export protein